MTVPDHPRIISEMISRGGEVQPPEGRGDGITLEWFCVVTVVTRRDDPKTTVDRGRHSIFFRSWNLEYHEIETNQQSNNLLCAT